MSLFGIDNQNLITGQYIPFSGAGLPAGGMPMNSAPAVSGANNNVSEFELLLEKQAGQLMSFEASSQALPGASPLASPEASLKALHDTPNGGTDIPVLAGGKAEIDKTSKLFEMCQEFETFLLKTLISSMRNTIQKSDLIDTGYAGQVYEDMLYDEYAKDFAKNAGFGFAEMAYLELTGQRGKSK